MKKKKLPEENVKLIQLEERKWDEQNPFVECSKQFEKGQGNWIEKYSNLWAPGVLFCRLKRSQFLGSVEDKSFQRFALILFHPVP